ncbi:MAG: hypothetical protein M3O70_22095 [Actinomycetota bacterium]|nr:hypothetical protein [Actinomycetota bacterium]
MPGDYNWVDHSRLRRALQDRRETGSQRETAVASLLVAALAAGTAAVASAGLQGAELFVVVAVSVFAGPLVVWTALLIYRFVHPIPRFRIDLGEVLALGDSQSARQTFGIQALKGSEDYALRRLELRAKTPDGQTLGWEKVDYETLITGVRIYMARYPEAWPQPAGRYRLTWRTTTWGEPPQEIGTKELTYTDGGTWTEAAEE